MDNNKSPHILNSSSNLLGFCFIVLTSLHILNRSEQTIIDEIVAFASLLFMTCSILSFLSIRSKNAKRSEWYENIADYIFLIGLFVLFSVIVVIVFNIFQ